MTVDEAFVDARFERGGEYADFAHGRPGSPCDVERRVRDRYLMLAATNDDHFVAPGGITHDRRPGVTTPPAGRSRSGRRRSPIAACTRSRWRRRAGSAAVRGDASQALAREAAAQHFLTDAFTAGHMRTPVAQIRRFWRARYPTFWDDLRGRVAADTAATLRELTWPLRLLPERFLQDATLAAVRRRTDPIRSCRWGISWPACFTTGTTPTGSRSTAATSCSATVMSTRARRAGSPSPPPGRGSTTSRSPSSSVRPATVSPASRCTAPCARPRAPAVVCFGPSA